VSSPQIVVDGQEDTLVLWDLAGEDADVDLQPLIDRGWTLFEASANRQKSKISFMKSRYAW
jgi:hypothetical protein